MQRACRIRTLLTVVLTAAAVVSAHAQEDACAAFAWPLAREQALLSAAILSNAETGGRIRPNEAYLVRLRPMGDVAFALAPERREAACTMRSARLLQPEFRSRRRFLHQSAPIGWPLPANLWNSWM